MRPHCWPWLEDGVYGDVDRFIDALEAGHHEQEWLRRVANNALDEEKIRQFIIQSGGWETTPRNGGRAAV